MLKPVHHLLSVLLAGVLSMLIPQNSLGQNALAVLENLNIEDGLSQTTVAEVLQDSRGVMWFGTEDGLNSYDGYQFTHYKHQPYDSSSLNGSIVTSILEDSLGNLWIGTFNGINKFDIGAEQFTSFPGANDTITRAIVLDMTFDARGKLVIANYDRITQFDPLTETYQAYPYRKGQPHSVGRVNYCLLSLDQDAVWIGTEDGIVVLDLYGQTVHPLIGKLGEACQGLVVFDLMKDSQQRIWVSTSEGLLRYDPEHETIEEYLWNPQLVQSEWGLMDLMEDSNGYIWAAAYNNVPYVLAPGTTVFQELTLPKNMEAFTSITSFYEDDSGIIWIGSYNGVYKFDPNRWKFQHHNESQTDTGEIHSVRGVRGFTDTPQGTVLVASSGDGIHEFDPKTKELKSLLPFFQELYPEFNKNIKTLLWDSHNILWIGLWLDGLYRYDTKSQQLEHIVPHPDNPNGLQNKGIRSILEDPFGDVWIGTHAGLNKYHYETDEFTFYEASNDSLGLTDLGVQVLFLDSNDNLWAGTSRGGVNKYDFETQTFEKYYYDPDNPSGISYNYITSFAETSPGILWVGTYGGGLNRLDTESGEITHYNTDSGLPNDVIYGLLKDESDNLWISSNAGLARFDHLTKTFTTFDVHDGLQSNEFNSGAYFHSGNGQLFFGGVNGFNAFHAHEIAGNEHTPKMLFTDFQINNESVIPGPESVLQYPIGNSSKVELNHLQTVFSLEFVALNYTDSRKNQYAYQLEGFDEEWQNLGTRNFITFTNIDPGTYTLRVKGSNNDGVWNEEGLKLEIVILPPWWRAPAAYMVYLAAALLALFFWRRQVIRRANLQARYEVEHLKLEKVRELDRLKSTFFENISHEFRTPLTLIQGPLESIYKKGVTPELQAPYQVMINNSRRLQQLIDQLMDLSKLEAGKMHLQSSYQNLVPVLRSVYEMCQPQLAEQPVSMHLKLHCEELWLYFDKDKIQKILYNLISNAFKFTTEGEINITLSKEGAFAQLIVSDSGPGIPEHLHKKIFDRFYQSSTEPAAQGTGIGLALTKELVDLHQGTIDLQSSSHRGTSFRVRIPINGKDQHKQANSKVAAQNLHFELQLAPVQTSEWISTPTEDVTCKILVVEDQVELRGFLKSILGESYLVATAENGEQGWQWAIEHLPDLIVSDIRMPKMDGFTLCEKLKTDRRTSHIPVVLLTAKSSKPHKLKGLEIGADDYLIKPFDEDELMALIKNRISQRILLREQFSKSVYLEPAQLALTPADEVFLNHALQLMEQHMDNSEFRVEAFLKEIGMSRTQLHRKLKALTGQSTTEFMRSIRLKRAAQLLKENHGNVSEVSDAVGFTRVSTFIREFRKMYQITPLQFRKAHYLSS